MKYVLSMRPISSLSCHRLQGCWGICAPVMQLPGACSVQSSIHECITGMAGTVKGMICVTLLFGLSGCESSCDLAYLGAWVACD